MVMAATVRHPRFESHICRFFYSPFSPSGLSSNETCIIHDNVIYIALYVMAGAVGCWANLSDDKGFH